MNTKKWFLLPLLLMASLCTTGVLAQQRDTVRAEVGKPLLAAQEFIKAKKYKEALRTLEEVDAVPNKTGYEVFVLEQTRGAAAAGAGDSQIAVQSLEKVIQSGRLTAGERLQMMEAIASTLFREKQYAQAIIWAKSYFANGGNNPQVRTLLIHALYLSGKYGEAATELLTDIAAAESAGAAVPEQNLQLLANSYLKSQDLGGYTSTLKKLVQRYPKKDYWAELIDRTANRPGFSSRLTLDVYRLRAATDNLRDANSYMDMAQLALQAGFPSEAKKIVDEGFKRRLLGGGQGAARQARLRDVANRDAEADLKEIEKSLAVPEHAKSGTEMVNLGYALVTVGKADKGVALMERGLAKGGVQEKEEAKLHLGMALLAAGNKTKGVEILKSVKGKSGAADLADLWIIHAERK